MWQVVIREQSTRRSGREVGHGCQIVALVDSADARIDDCLDHRHGQLGLWLPQFAHDPGERLV